MMSIYSHYTLCAIKIRIKMGQNVKLLFEECIQSSCEIKVVIKKKINELMFNRVSLMLFSFFHIYFKLKVKLFGIY